jgi:hypothetical protein
MVCRRQSEPLIEKSNSQVKRKRSKIYIFSKRGICQDRQWSNNNQKIGFERTVGQLRQTGSLRRELNQYYWHACVMYSRAIASSRLNELCY